MVYLAVGILQVTKNPALAGTRRSAHRLQPTLQALLAKGALLGFAGSYLGSRLSRDGMAGKRGLVI
jgi:hypothetical protein